MKSRTPEVYSNFLMSRFYFSVYMCVFLKNLLNIQCIECQTVHIFCRKLYFVMSGIDKGSGSGAHHLPFIRCFREVQYVLFQYYSF